MKHLLKLALATSTVLLGGLADTPSRAAVLTPTLSYSTYFGGEAEDLAADIERDREGNIYFLINLTSGTQGRGQDVAVVKFNPTGDKVIFGVYIGGGVTDTGHDMALDRDGNVYITGYTGSNVEFPTTPNAYPTSDPGSPFPSLTIPTTFFTVLSADGKSLLYSTLFMAEEGKAIAVDEQGYVYVGGNAASSVMPTTPGAFIEKAKYSLLGHPFVAKFDIKKSGKESLVYSTYLASEGGGTVNALEVDGQGNVYVAGQALEKFPVTENAYQKTFAGSGIAWGDAIVAKLNPSGSALLYASYLGSTFNETANALALDTRGRVTITGWIESYGLPTTPGVFQPEWMPGNCGDLEFQPCTDAFVARFDPNASGAASLVYSTYLGGNRQEYGEDVEVDAAGNAYVIGTSYSLLDTFPIQNAYQAQRSGASDAFVTKISPAGTLLLSTYFGGSGKDQGEALTLGANGDLHLIGHTESTDVPVRNPFQEKSEGGVEVFITTLHDPSAGEEPDVMPGDLNADGKVTVSDATLALRMSVGLEGPTPEQLQAADMNGDGALSVLDVTMILKKAVGL